MAKRPNILFLLNDHQAFYRHGWDGGPAVRRPHFERLAAGGVVFTRAYTACALCGPARRTMLTGLYPHNHGELQNDTGHPFDRETYYDRLADAGYRCFYFGKWHAGPGTAHDHHCTGFSYPSYNNPYTKPEYAEYLARRGLPRPRIIVERNFRATGPQAGEEMVQDRPWCNEHASGILQTPEDTHEAFFLANLACDRLRWLASSGGDRPFCLRVDFWGPHQPYFPTQRYADHYDPRTIPEYGSFRDDLVDKPRIYRDETNVPMGCAGPNGKSIVTPNPLPWEEWQRTLALCYAQITMIDAAGGRILDALEELGFADNTLVVWTTDHGDAIACHGGHFDKSAYLPEEMIRIPMAIRCPGTIPAGRSLDALVGNVDIAPTLLDAAGTRFRTAVDGRSLLPLCRGDAAEWRADLLSETHGHGAEHIGRVVVSRRYKYVWNRGDMDELYDLESDPFEMRNLVESSGMSRVLAGMKTRLAAWQRETGDPAVP